MTQPLSIDVAERIRPRTRALDDPAETFHEAAKLAPSTIGAQLAGAARLALDPTLQASTRRAARRHVHRPAVQLPPPDVGSATLADAIATRRSRLPDARTPISLGQLGALLAVGYGARATPAGSRRTVPSAGALYPLDLYVLPWSVSGLDATVHHYDPYLHALVALAGRDGEAVDAAWYEPEIAARAAAAVVVAGVFLRARCKYDQRGYRFTLLEAGHVGQNLALAAAAIGRSTLPYGGFYDRRIDALLGLDGVEESSLHVVFVG
jgi:SagB-type dehydrogenase family enzyme